MSEGQTPTNPDAELVAVVEDLVERQRQILGALVTGRPPSRDSVQAVLLGMRGVETKLRNGAAEADATTPTNPDLRSQVADRLSAVGITHTPSTTLDPLYDRLAERVVQDVINPLMERLQRERDAYRDECVQMERNWDAAREANEEALGTIHDLRRELVELRTQQASAARPCRDCGMPTNGDNDGYCRSYPSVSNEEDR